MLTGTRALAASAALALLLCGCGSPSRADRGRAIFRSACASCHTLTGHETQTAGGDLAVAELGVRDLRSFTRVMPGRLTAADVDAVAAYVRAAELRAHGG